MCKDKTIAAIQSGATSLGIEFGSTRIKAVLINDEHETIASGSHEWENRLENGIWTYSLEDIWNGLQDSYRDLKEDVKKQYGIELETIGAIGFSAMMHGYMAFDEQNELLVPFRTWRNNITEPATKVLTPLFGQQIPQRWTIAHLYQAILNGEEHVSKLAYVTTLAGYIHWQLTGEKVLGIGDASGMFPIDSDTLDYHEEMVQKFDALIAEKNYPWKLRQIFPQVRTAGQNAGVLTEEGAKLLDPSGTLKPGIPVCPPEGDAGTGMAATNSVAKRTGNVSAGTSIFAMIVLEKPLSKVYEEIDPVTTPDGSPVAMVHSQNCTSDLNAWAGLFRETLESFGVKVDANELYGTLYRKALEGDADCGGLLSYCYYSGEHITHFEEGRPLFVRTPDSKLNLANFMRTHLYTCMGALKMGMDILLKNEGVVVDKLLGHGGLFKTKGVGQKFMADAMNAPVAVMETAGEGGAWGIGILAAYMKNKEEGESLSAYLENKVFAGKESTQITPEPEGTAGFEAFMERYKNGLAIERAAVEHLS
ncbi:MAG: FGGY-family carbohydrate kinase [Oliverpabstia sp.]|nr:FGGY-family carbohydrate kinase [Oliverpabstia sp.]